MRAERPRRESRQLEHTVLDELRAHKEKPFVPTPDIDMVWVVSQPGTALKPSSDGIYKGVSTDRKVIDYGIDLIKEITALRLGKDVSEVTRYDIESSGPVLFYNGEDNTTENSAYPQNEDLETLAQEPDFPIPRSKIVIQHIPKLGTHTQVQELASYLQLQHGPPRKIAVVSMGPHSPRVSRYLQHYKDLLPKDVKLVNAPVFEADKPVGKLFREIGKIVKYAEKGDLSKEPLENF